MDAPRKLQPKKRRLTESELALFLKQYARKGGGKGQPNHDPNDRHYSRKVEKMIKRMTPEELDRLMSDYT